MGDAAHQRDHERPDGRPRAVLARRTWLVCALAVTFLVAGIGVAVVHAPAAPVPATRFHKVHKRRFCGHRSYEILPDGLIVRNDVYHPDVFQCIRVTGNRIKVVRSYRVRRGRTGALVGSYPSVFAGCNIFGLCAKRGYRPVRVSALKAVYITVSTTFPRNYGRQQANDASDDYFTTGPLDGPRAIRAEFMMLLGWRRLGSAPPLATLRSQGITWRLAWWVTGGDGHRHMLIQARAGYGRRRSLRHYNAMPLINLLIRRGLVKRSWMATQWAWGNECWVACRGDAIKRYSVRAVTR
jgi:hypothetical protein